MEQWTQLLANVGFPIFVSFFLLQRIETKLEAILQAIVQQSIER